MKKLICKFSFLLIVCTQFMIGQTYTTGTVDLSAGNGFSAEISVTGSEVTLTLVGPDGRWMGLGFGESCMVTDGDVVIFDGTDLSDRTFIAVGVTPSVDTTQDWTITSSTETGGVRTVIATRALDTGEANDYVFSAVEEPITLVWALGFSNVISSHGGGNRGATTSDFVLGIEELFTAEFKMYPNPATDIVRLDLPQEITSGDITVMDYTGKAILTSSIDSLNKSLDVSSLESGVYLLNFDTQQGRIARKLLID